VHEVIFWKLLTGYDLLENKAKIARKPIAGTIEYEICLSPGTHPTSKKSDREALPFFGEKSKKESFV